MGGALRRDPGWLELREVPGVRVRLSRDQTYSTPDERGGRVQGHSGGTPIRPPTGGSSPGLERTGGVTGRARKCGDCNTRMTYRGVGNRRR